MAPKKISATAAAVASSAAQLMKKPAAVGLKHPKQAVPPPKAVKEVKPLPEPEVNEQEIGIDDADEHEDEEEEEEEGEEEEMEDDVAEDKADDEIQDQPSASSAAAASARRWSVQDSVDSAILESPGKRTRVEDATADGASVSVAAPGSLSVAYNLEGNGGSQLSEGLVRLRRVGLHCDASVVTGSGARINVHRLVLASSSPTLDERLKSTTDGELNLGTTSHEAADIFVRWVYGEVSAATFRPTTPQVNEEVLRLSSDLGLPRLSELCALQLASGVTVFNIVSRISLCEEFGLPALRSALVCALIENKVALATVSQASETLGHPALMRELLAGLAHRAQMSEEIANVSTVVAESSKSVDAMRRRVKGA
eukprot:TRINITY_DN2516_c2_g1_i1.p1 TRINITY_DN2516_c2_g1~~TRINITY_DN2516_c2_g1_i1.p1  ORF type:complete len:369 (+),score=85.88 TRINITY_DN2516_c2_g1_i1:78-1184(+)